MGRLAISLRGVRYRYPGAKTWALNGLNLDVLEGSVVVITGPTGSGKTTLLRVARGLNRHFGGETTGEIRVLGRRIQDYSDAELASIMSLVFQDPSVQLHQSRVIDELISTPMYQGLPWKECEDRAWRVATRILDSELLGKRTSELSSGEQQRVAIAASLVGKSEMLLLDDPLSFTDLGGVDSFLALIEELNASGKTIVITAHDLEPFLALADRVVVLDRGQCVLDGPPNEVLISREFEKLLVPPLVVRVAKRLQESKKGPNDPVRDWNDILRQVSLGACRRQARDSRKDAPTNGHKLLKLANVSFSYRDQELVLESVSLAVREGEILGLLGPNGSGKTTLAKIAAGILPPETGESCYEGSPTFKLNPVKRAKSVGYVTQNPVDMLFETTVLKECAFGPVCLGVEEAERKAHEALDEVGLQQLANRHPDSLSEGQKRLLTIADIVVNEPRLLMLDEPMFGLDTNARALLESKIQQIRRADMTVILIAHDLQSLAFLCDRIIVLDGGRILEEGKLHELSANPVNHSTLDTVTNGFLQLVERLSPEALESEGHFIDRVAALAQLGQGATGTTS